MNCIKLFEIVLRGGSSETPALFGVREGLSSDKAVGFELLNAEVKDGGSVWLRYKVKR